VLAPQQQETIKLRTTSSPKGAISPKSFMMFGERARLESKDAQTPKDQVSTARITPTDTRQQVRKHNVAIALGTLAIR